MFNSLIVAIDVEDDGDGALPVVRALNALADVDVELLTVSPPSQTSDVDAFELSRRALANGWPPHAYRILHADDVAEALAAEVNARPEALLVMATSAKAPLLGHLLGSISEAVLRLVERPVLLVGPHVPAELHWSRPTPVVCVPPNGADRSIVHAVTAFWHTFPTAPLRIVQIVPQGDAGVAGSDAERPSPLTQMTGLLAAEGVESRCRVVHGGVPEVRLEELADQVLQPFFVVGSARWTGGHHWRSTTRRLVHRSSHPVLVVPTRSNATPDPHPDTTIARPARASEQAGKQSVP